MTALDTFVVTTTLSTIHTDLAASVEGLEWTVNAYNLIFAVVSLTAAARRRPVAGGGGCSSVGIASLRPRFRRVRASADRSGR